VIDGQESGSGVKWPERFIWIAYFATFTGYSVWRYTFTNYAVENFGVDVQQVGVLYSIAGIPGALAFTIALVARKVRIVVLLPFSCALVGIGLAWLGVAPVWQDLWPGLLAISLGVACFYPVITSLVLLNTTEAAAPVSIGRTKSFGPLASIGAAGLVIYFVPELGASRFLVLVGAAVLVGGVVAGLGIRRSAIAPIRGTLEFRIALWPFYAMNFLAGCRSALFKTLAIYVLVTEHGFEFHHTALIVLAGNGLTFVGYHLIGHLVRVHGSRNVLSVIYLIVAGVFLGFAFGGSPLLLSALFLVDSLIFGASVATESHLKTIAVPEQYIGHVATGFTLFSIAGLVMPAVGGFVWDQVGREPAFLFGSAVAVVAVGVSRLLGRYHKG
jgi:hypothetical protein